MKSLIAKRSIVIAGHKTSVSLEDAFWQALKAVADGRGLTLGDMVQHIDEERQGRMGNHNLSSAIRLFLFDHYKSIAEESKRSA